MKVLVELEGARRRYTYEAWDTIQVGDPVTVPGPPWDPRSEQRGTVVELDSDYGGPVRRVLGEWPEDRPPDEEFVHEGNATAPEKAAWQVAITRGLNISRNDIRALLSAAQAAAGAGDEPPY